MVCIGEPVTHHLQKTHNTCQKGTIMAGKTRFNIGASSGVKDATIHEAMAAGWNVGSFTQSKDNLDATMTTCKAGSN